MNKLLFPKKTKYKKQHKFKQKQEIRPKLSFGNVGLYVLSPCFINSNQLESCRKTILRYTKRIGKIKFNILPDNSRTKKSEGSRMGGGKGNHTFWVSAVNKGKAILELKDVPLNVANVALKQVKYKLPVNAKIFYEKS